MPDPGLCCIQFLFNILLFIDAGNAEWRFAAGRKEKDRFGFDGNGMVNDERPNEGGSFVPGMFEELPSFHLSTALNLTNPCS